MRTSENITELCKAFVAAQAELKNATFDKVNPHFKSKYASLAGMRDGIVAVLSKHGLAIMQGNDTIGNGSDHVCVVSTRLLHESGQWIESYYPFAIDKPQQMGSAMTYARRYSLAAICGIASEEDDDGNAAQGGGSNGETEAIERKPHDRSPLVRKEYERIDKGLNDIFQTGSLEDLRAFWVAEKLVIEHLPADWRSMITAKKDEIKEQLGAKAA